MIFLNEVETAELYETDAHKAQMLEEMREWIREAVRLMELSQYNVENGYYDDELAALLRAHIEKVKS